MYSDCHPLIYHCNENWSWVNIRSFSKRPSNYELTVPERLRAKALAGSYDLKSENEKFFERIDQSEANARSRVVEKGACDWLNSKKHMLTFVKIVVGRFSASLRFAWHMSKDPCRLCFISNTSQLVRGAFPESLRGKKEVFAPPESELCEWESERGQKKGRPDLAQPFRISYFQRVCFSLVFVHGRIRKRRRRKSIVKKGLLAFGDHHHHHRPLVLLVDRQILA